MIKPNYLSEEKKMYEEAFGDVWKTVYDFFYKQLDFGGAIREERKIPLKKRRIQCAKELVSLYGYDALLKAMSIYEEKLRLGILYKKSVPYFKKIVENSCVREPEIKDISEVVPIPKERRYDQYEEEIYNWVFTCPVCGAEVAKWDQRCPTCVPWVWFAWEK